MPLLKKYKLNITWGDQDLLNIIFFHNPGNHLISLILCICKKKLQILFSQNEMHLFDLALY